MSNVYAAPTAEFTDNSEFGDTRMFTLSGRIGRVRWLGYSTAASMLTSVLLGVAIALVASQAEVALFLPILNLVFTMAIFVIMARRRCHDLGVSPWMMLIGFIPLVNLYFIYLMLFKRGDDGANEYGPPPRPNDRAAILLAWLVPGIMVIGVVAAIALPAYQGYTMKAKAAQQMEVAPR